MKKLTWVFMTLALTCRAEPPPDAMIAKLAAVIREHCPAANVAVSNGVFAAKNDTMIFTAHGHQMTGEVVPETHRVEGPKFKGFILTVQVREGAYDGQALVPQVLQGPYYPTYLDAPPTEDGKNHYWVVLSCGKGLDAKLKRGIFAALPGRRFQPYDGEDLSAAEAGVRGLNPPARIAGSLGKPLGARLIVAGVLAERVMLSNPLAIDRVDGHPLSESVSIEIRGKPDIQKGVRYRLEGYEAGEFSGYPSWAAPKAQQPFQYRGFLVVTKVLEAKTD